MVGCRSRSQYGECSSCGAQIAWTITKNDKRMPINPAGDPAGNLVLAGKQATDRGMTPVVHYLKKDEVTAAQRYTSHFATCPKAAEHRRK